MATGQSVAIIIGSLRQNSLTRKIAGQLVAHAPDHMNCTLLSVDMPLYNQDLDNDPPAAWQAFRQAITVSDGVIFASPEYNRSMPGGLKNAIDIGSRPYMQGVLIGKPAAVVSQSPSPLGPTLANHALRQSLVFLNMPVLQQPELYINRSVTLFDEEGAYIGAEQAPPFAAFMAAFSDWISRMSKAQA